MEKWRIRGVKRDGKKSMKKNYAACLIVSLIMVFLVVGTVSVSQTIDKTTETIYDIGQVTNSKSLVDLSHDITSFEQTVREATSLGPDSSAGVIAGIYHGTKATGTLAGGILTLFDNVLFNSEVSIALITSLGLIIALLYWLFIENILKVGTARFFMENNLYEGTTVSRLLLIFRVKKVRHCAWIMLLKAFFTALWFLTIVGGIIKLYSYRLIPYIIAENPNISRKEAFDLSMKMMKGNKWRAFLLDVSFVPWWILSILTFGIVKYLWMDPYMRSTYADLYFAIRAEALDTPIEMEPEPEGKKLTYDYHRKYTLTNLILLFFAFAMFGWVWECTLEIIQHGHFVNRGSLYGPWIPIYGFGGLGLVVLLRKVVDHPIVTFFLAVLICGLLEGLTGWYLDVVRGMRYWDYTDYYFNIGGYVCLESLLVFGLGGCAFIYLFAPMLDTYFNKIPKKGRVGLCCVLVTAFLGDVVYSHFNPHVGDHIGGYVENGSGDGS